MKINQLYEAMKNFKVTYEYTKDMYDLKDKCIDLTDINPPPPYKKVKSFTQQKRFKSLGESFGGNTQQSINKSNKSNNITSAGKHTRVRYLNKKRDRTIQ